MPTFTLVTLVPKLQLGNPVDEAPASRDGKLELPALNSQAGAWELAQPAQVTVNVNVDLFSFPRAAWECGQGALRRKSRCLYGTQRVQYCIPTQRVGTRSSDAASRRHLCIKTGSGAWEPAQPAQVTVNVDLPDQEPA